MVSCPKLINLLPASKPEWLLNDMGWYEGTELQWIQDSDIICIEEAE